MILRKSHLQLISIILVSLHACQGQDDESGKVYDENEWIPISPKRVVEIDADKVTLQAKKATPRVLNLNEPPQGNAFFPDEGKPALVDQPFQQYLRETSNIPYQKPALQRVKLPLNQHPYKFERLPPNERPPRPVKNEPQPTFAFQSTQPQFAQVQFYQPQEYHTIPEEYLNQPLPSHAQPPLSNNYQSIHLQNVEQPELQPLRVNSSQSGHIQFPEKKQRKPVQQFNGPPLTSQKLGEEKESVQLLYVPLESLAPKVPHRLHAYQQAPVPEIQQQFDTYRPDFSGHREQQIKNIQSDFARQAADAHKLQLQFQQQPYALPVIDLVTDPPTTLPPPTTTTTTKRPTSKKRKAHQPPLAVYMGDGEDADISDVLALLKDAKTIDVQDSISAASPKIFVGPSSLNPPRGYAKFELPYLSSIDSNRVERKVEQLPFFVAPLSYKTPPGYSKIPLPSPHVGSVVVSNKEKLKEKDASSKLPQGHLQNLPEGYQLQPQYEIRQPDYSVRPAISSSTPRYSKPIPEDHVINQYEIDQINSFIPQQQQQQQYEQEDITSTQRQPEKYNLGQVKSRPTVSHIRFGTAIPPAQTQLTEDQFIDEILTQHQQPKETNYQRPAPQQYDQYIHQQVTPQFVRPQQQYFQQHVTEPEPKYVEQTRTRTQNYRGRPATTPSSLAEEYEERETVKTTRAPTKVRTNSRPTQSQEILSRTTTHLRSRPPTTTTTEPVIYDQYLKETIMEPKPKARPAPSPVQIDEQTYQFVPIRSSTPSPQFLYSVSPTRSEPTSNSKTRYQYEEEEERHPIRPVIFKYKQSSDEETHQNQQDVSKYSTPRTQVYSTPKSPNVNEQSVELSNANFVTGPQSVYQEDYIASNVKTQNANVENYNLEVQPLQPQLIQKPQQLPNIINNLEDQSVRQLLHPGLIPTSPKTNLYQQYVSSTLAPTAHEEVFTTTQAPTSNYPSTHLPVVESTTKKAAIRSRQRGSRFTTTTESPDNQTRKTVTRGRRPLPGRSRYQDEETTVTPTDYTARSSTDPTKRVVTARSRFRTRGRPANSETTDRNDKLVYSTYSNDANQDTTVRIVEAVTPREQYVIQNYRPVYNVPEDQSDPIIYRKLVHKPATEPVVIHQINQLPIKNLEEEHAESTSTKGTNRARTRQRVIVSSTQAPHVVSSTSRRYETNSKENENEQEFYGFFREPSFKKAVSETPETQRPVYSSTYISSTSKYDNDNEEIVPSQRHRQQPSSTTDNHLVSFVGEIRPKYQTTAQSITERAYQQVSSTTPTETRTRSRVRIPSRRVTTEATETEEVAKRGRTRGKTHFRVPMKPKTRNQSGEDEDVEGGNYPVQYKAFQTSTTARPQFQITIDPQDDQDTYSSVYLPTYVSKDTGNKDANYVVEDYQNRNLIQDSHQKSSTEKNDDLLVTDAPIALPSIASADVTAQQIKEEEDFEKIVEDFLSNKDSHAEKQSVDLDYAVTTFAPETTTHKRRRGVWKLIKRPVDDFAVAESQNPTGSKLNLLLNDPIKEEVAKTDITQNFEDIQVTTVESLPEQTEPTTTTTESSGFFDSIYSMFGVNEEKTQAPNVTVDASVDEENVKITSKPLDEVNIEDITTIDSKIESEEESSFITTTPTTSMTYITPMSLESWNKGILKTSTSTEISHETEICYKGKCIKSKDMKVPMT